MRAIFILAVALAGCAGKAEPVPTRVEAAVSLAWTAATGDSWDLRVVSGRKAEVSTGKEPTSTEFQLTIAGVLRVTAISAEGTRECEFTFASLEGTVQALGVSMPITDNPTEVAGRKIRATLNSVGQLVWDAEALRQVSPGLDLNDDLAGLFPALPRDPVAAGEKWTDVVDRHTDEYELRRVEEREGKRFAIFAGTSKADEVKGGAALTSSLRVNGHFAGEWDVSAGCLGRFELERKEEARIVAKASVMVTTTEVKRLVVMTRK
ncbi:MAG: hypothetical protein K8T20_16940 [Planctomycetes bacterium]|nr:hypothetical protein [Planctomycetota bacterium]